MGGHDNNFRLPTTRWACTPLSGTAPDIMLVRFIFDETYTSRTSVNYYRSRSDFGQWNRTYFVPLIADQFDMTPQLLDHMFPFFVFSYGFLILLVLETLPNFVQAKISSHPLFMRIQKRKPLAWICFFIGGVWSLQNIWMQY